MNGSVKQNENEDGNNNSIPNDDGNGIFNGGDGADGGDGVNRGDGGNGADEDGNNNIDNIGNGYKADDDVHDGNVYDGNDANDGNAQSRYAGSDSSNGEKISPGLGDLLTMGAASGISVGGGLMLGIVLDNHFHTDPYFTFSGLGLGIVVAGGVIFSEVKKYL